MLRKTTLMAGLATLFISTPVQALEHEILVLPDAYFPQTSYVTAGDTLIFFNEVGASITVTSIDEQWSTGPMGMDQSSIIPVSDGMTTDFYLEGSEDENSVPAVTGIISFVVAPLDRGTTNTETEVEDQAQPVN